MERCFSEDGTTMRCGLRTNFQDEDRKKEGEENVVCSISCRSFAFCHCVVSLGVLVASWRFFWLTFFSFFCFFVLWDHSCFQNADA